MQIWDDDPNAEIDEEKLERAIERINEHMKENYVTREEAKKATVVTGEAYIQNNKVAALTHALACSYIELLDEKEEHRDKLRRVFGEVGVRWNEGDDMVAAAADEIAKLRAVAEAAKACRNADSLFEKEGKKVRLRGELYEALAKLDQE